ncbi:MAG: sodium:calcium antiporter [Clostridia bacterium]
MIFLAYLFVAAVLVLFSVKCADYVDMIDKKTDLSGAFIGGVILAAVTSLPELITSISAVALGNDDLIIGNVLGSDLFNLCIFGGLTLISTKAFAKSSVGISNLKTIICTILAYVVTGFVLFSDFNTTIPGVSINFVSIIIVILYAIACKFMTGDESESDSEDDELLTLKQVVVRFVLCASGLVASSVIITQITDTITKVYPIFGSSLAGAIFLGVATSIPELTSSITLVRKGNFNAMVGNVVGSNMFNFIIFSLADILAFRTDVYHSLVPETVTMVGFTSSQLLIVFGLFSAFVTGASLIVKYKTSKNSEASKGSVANVMIKIFGALILLSYISYLVCSMTVAP